MVSKSESAACADAVPTASASPSSAALPNVRFIRSPTHTRRHSKSLRALGKAIRSTRVPISRQSDPATHPGLAAGPLIACARSDAAAQLLGGADEAGADARLHGGMAGIGDHTVFRFRPGAGELVGAHHRADHVVATCTMNPGMRLSRSTRHSR